MRRGRDSSNTVKRRRGGGNEGRKVKNVIGEKERVGNFQERGAKHIGNLTGRGGMGMREEEGTVGRERFGRGYKDGGEAEIEGAICGRKVLFFRGVFCEI